MIPLYNVKIFASHKHTFGAAYSAFRITITCGQNNNYQFQNKAYLKPLPKFICTLNCSYVALEEYGLKLRYLFHSAWKHNLLSDKEKG